VSISSHPPPTRPRGAFFLLSDRTPLSPTTFRMIALGSLPPDYPLTFTPPLYRKKLWPFPRVQERVYFNERAPPFSLLRVPRASLPPPLCSTDRCAERLNQPRSVSDCLAQSPMPRYFLSPLLKRLGRYLFPRSRFPPL